MIISHHKKFVILAPWKTASTTMRVRLAAYCETQYSAFYYFNPHLQRVVHQHVTYSEFRALPEARLGYFCAAFVRNPYDRVYSGFQQLQRDLKGQPLEVFSPPWIRNLVMRNLAANFAQICAAGYDFDQWVSLLEDHQIYEIGANVSFPLHPAHYWTHLDGQQTVDFIGRVERFEDDLNLLCARLGIESVDRTNANVGVEPLTTQQGQYKYIDRMNGASIARINELFDADFDLFDYQRVA